MDQKIIWCQKPFTDIDTNGIHASPCCKFEAASEIFLQNYFDNQEIIEVQQKVLRGEAPSQCRICVESEAVGGKSLRTQANNYDCCDGVLNKDNIKNLLVYSGNICNLSCIHCSEGASYTRGMEMLRLNIIQEKPVPTSQNLKHLLNFNFKKITIVGGEPFFDKNVLDLLYTLPAEKNSQNIELDINTNLTNITENLLNFLSQNYAKVQIKGSIDGFKRSNDYLRYPSKWKDIEDSIDIIKKFSVIELSVVTSISNLSLLTLPELIEWVITKGIRNHYFNLVHRPIELVPWLLPESIKNHLLHRFLEINHKIDRGYHDRTAELIDFCINFCQNKEINGDISLLINYLNKHDQLRKTKFLSFFPLLTQVGLNK